MDNSASKQDRTTAKNHSSADELLRIYRQRSGLTQKQLARQLGLETERMVRKWEVSVSLPGPGRLQKLIEFYLGLSVFVKGQEYHEAYELWTTVKNSYDVEIVKSRTYPPFDTGWFNELLIPMGAATGLAEPGLIELPLNQTALLPIHNLPVPVTSFIGREKELKELKGLLPATRLLTLVGMGGIGKTRLALQLAQQSLGNFNDGAWLIELAALTTAEQVVQAVVQGRYA